MAEYFFKYRRLISPYNREKQHLQILKPGFLKAFIFLTVVNNMKI